MHCSVTWRRPRTLGRTKEPWGVKKTVSWVNDGRRFLGQQIRSWPDPESTMGRLRQRQAIWNQRELTDPQERSLAGADWLLWWSKSLASQYHLCEDIEETEEKKKGQRKKGKRGVQEQYGQRRAATYTTTTTVCQQGGLRTECLTALNSDIVQEGYAAASRRRATLKIRCKGWNVSL